MHPPAGFRKSSGRAEPPLLSAEEEMAAEASAGGRVFVCGWLFANNRVLPENTVNLRVQGAWVAIPLYLIKRLTAHLAA